VAFAGGWGRGRAGCVFPIHLFPHQSGLTLTVGHSARQAADMPSPKFTFRLPEKDKAALLEVSKIYGAVSPGAFCAEMIGAVCSGDMERIKAFNAKLIRGMGEQLTLTLNGALDAATGAEKPAKKARKLAKTGKGAACRARPRKS